MKAAEWKRVVRSLLPDDGSWELRGSLCYRAPVRRVLLGVLGEGSGFDKGVYIWRVVMPLFVPSSNVVLSWSERIGGGARKYYGFDEDALATAIAAAMEGMGSEDDALVEIVGRDDPASHNRRLHEVVGYARLLQGDTTGAQEPLARAAAGVGRAPWEQEIIDRARLVSSLLEEGEPGEAVRQLDRWRDQTAGALGLRRSVGSNSKWPIERSQSGEGNG